jgi:hypothetical protein
MLLRFQTILPAKPQINYGDERFSKKDLERQTRNKCEQDILLDRSKSG